MDHPWAHLRVHRIQEAYESLRAWFILGLAAGLVTSRIVNTTGQGVVLHFVSGIVGAVMGGWLSTTFAVGGGNGFNLYRPILSLRRAGLLSVLKVVKVNVATFTDRSELAPKANLMQE